jgi:hypothetical protein
VRDPTAARPPRSTLTLRGVVPRASQAPVATPTEPAENFHWIVRRWGSGSRRPKVMHPTEEAAIAEATRLAAANRGVRYNVYECRLVRRVLK